MTNITKLTIEEIARRRRVKEETVRRWARAGLIEPCERLPRPDGRGRMLFLESELEKLDAAPSPRAEDIAAHVTASQVRARHRRRSM